MKHCTGFKAALPPLVPLLLLVGCSAPVGEAEGVGVAEAPLNSDSLVEYWPSTIPVCFEPQNLGDEATPWYAAMEAEARDAIEATWGSIPKADVVFSGWSRCANRTLGSLPGQIRIVLGANAAPISRACTANDSYSNIGVCAGPFDVNHELLLLLGNSAAGTTGHPFWRGVTSHEMGHCLRFNHEQDRVDAPPNGTNIYVDGDPEYGCRQSLYNSNETFLTRYDPLSIMGTSNCNSREHLSDGDELGAELAYPENGSTSLTGRRSLRTAGGILVRASDVLQPDWVSRGALGTMFAGGVTWTINGATFTTPTTALACTILAPSAQVGGQFVDGLAMTRTMATQTVLVSTRRHTALVRSVL